MNKFLKKLSLAGLGLISYTEKELSAIFDKLIKEGKMNEPEAKQLIAEIKLKGKKYWNEYLTKTENMLKEAAKKIKTYKYKKLTKK